MTKVESKKTGKLRRTSPIPAPAFIFGKEESMLKEKALIGRTKNYGSCNKCNGTGVRGTYVSYKGFPCAPTPIPCRCATKVLETESLEAAAAVAPATGSTGVQG